MVSPRSRGEDLGGRGSDCSKEILVTSSVGALLLWPRGLARGPDRALASLGKVGLDTDTGQHKARDTQLATPVCTSPDTPGRKLEDFVSEPWAPSAPPLLRVLGPEGMVRPEG